MATNLLWAHLLRKDATGTESPSQIPPIAPLDKTGTSIRMLIHDTQVNLEKFSARLDVLLQRVGDCRTQVVNANKLLDVERDKVLTEILEIANRCQSEMKAHIGTPAQAPALDILHVSQISTEKSVQALEKRIDALQALLQTHTHAMQSIQDQQNTLIGAVMPLVPIIHGVPPQMDQIKTALSDMVTNAVSTMANSVKGVRSTLITELAHGYAGSPTRVGSSSEPILSPRRKRSSAPTPGCRDIEVPISSPLDSRSYSGPRLSLKRARVEGMPCHEKNAQLPRKLSRFTAPPTNSSDRPPLWTPRTPRRPLADLLLPPVNNTPSCQHYMASHGNPTSRGYMRSLNTLPSTGGPRIISGPPLQPIVRARSDLQGPVTERRPVARHDIPLAIDRSIADLPGAAGSSDRDSISRAIKIEEIVEPNLTGVFSIHSSPLSSPPSSAPLVIGHDPQETSTNIGQPSTRLQDDMEGDSQIKPVHAPPSSFDPFCSKPGASPPTSMSLRARRAQISRFGRTETRRFLPLVPWSDEE